MWDFLKLPRRQIEQISTVLCAVQYLTLDVSLIKACFTAFSSVIGDGIKSLITDLLSSTCSNREETEQCFSYSSTGLYFKILFYFFLSFLLAQGIQ